MRPGRQNDACAVLAVSAYLTGPGRTLLRCAVSGWVRVAGVGVAVVAGAAGAGRVRAGLVRAGGAGAVWGS